MAAETLTNQAVFRGGMECHNDKDLGARISAIVSRNMSFFNTAITVRGRNSSRPCRQQQGGEWPAGTIAASRRCTAVIPSMRQEQSACSYLLEAPEMS